MTFPEVVKLDRNCIEWVLGGGSEQLSFFLFHFSCPSFAGEKKELPLPNAAQAELREIRNAEENADTKLEGRVRPCS